MPGSDKSGETKKELQPEQSAQTESPSDIKEAAGDAVNADGASAPEDVLDEPEKEVFYTFKWGRRPPRRGANHGAENSKSSGNKKPSKRKPKPKKRPESTGAKKFQARPEKKQTIDPDNPFAAALMGLKTKE